MLDAAHLLEVYLLGSMGILLGLLAAFAGYHLILSVGGWRRQPTRTAERAPRAPPVTFVVTAYRDAEVVVGCIDSILALDHPADRLRVLVVADEDDVGTLAAIRARLDGPDARASKNAEGDIVIQAGRVTAVFQVGPRAGRGKPRALQNAMRYLPREGFVGILDSDHVLARDFLVETLPQFDDPAVGIVQARRAPKETPRNWIQRWDVLEQNVGQVQALLARDRVGCASFYGSTALVRAHVLWEIGWENCLAEDTLFHYDLRERGYRTCYVVTTGSVEEHVATLRHFIVQRRRWAAGHMQVLAAKAGCVFSPHLRWIERLEALFHLNYYNVALLLLAYWLLRAIHYWVQGPLVALLPVVAASALVGLAAGVAERSHGARQGVPISGGLVAGLLALSVLSLVTSYALPARTGPPFPVAMEVVTFAAPLFQIGAGYLNPTLRVDAAGARDHWRYGATLILAAPVMVLVNLYAALTGIAASIANRPAVWIKTPRHSRGTSAWTRIS